MAARVARTRICPEDHTFHQPALGQPHGTTYAASARAQHVLPTIGMAYHPELVLFNLCEWLLGG